MYASGPNFSKREPALSATSSCGGSAAYDGRLRFLKLFISSALTITRSKAAYSGAKGSVLSSYKCDGKELASARDISRGIPSAGAMSALKNSYRTWLI